MKTKFFTLIFSFALLLSCTNELPKGETEIVEYITDDITTLVVPEGHDLRPIALQNTNINLSEDSRADIVKVRIYKIENDENKLIYSGAIDRNTSINSIVKVPNHVSLLSVQADLAAGTREWIVTPAELESLIIEDEEVVDVDEDETEAKAKSATAAKTSVTYAQKDAPTWSCDDYKDFSGNDNGDFKISNNSTQGINVDKKTEIYICSGGSWKPGYLNDNGGKLTIYVASGATLTLSGSINSTIYNIGTFNGTNLEVKEDSKFENWGTANITGAFNVSSNDVENYEGVFNVSGSLSVRDKGDFDNEGGTINVGGHVTVSGNLHNKENSTLNVAGHFTVNSKGDFENECRTIISGNFINNQKVNFDNASYTVVTGSFTNNSNGEVSIKEGSIFKCASIMSNAKIKGSKAYSIIETGAITFNGNSRFEGELDICSDSFKDDMGNNKVLSTCTTFISSGGCSPGYNNLIDEDKDGVIAGVDVDDNNPNVSSYNYPQGQNSFFTTIYEDLYPCMGDYDLNDLVHNYSYSEGVNTSGSVTEIAFDYKFPAMGGAFNNSFVLRVMDEDDNATLSLENSTYYSATGIQRLHDSENKTTLFIFNNIKSIYTSNTGAIVNTAREDYTVIPVISGKVLNINGAYDEFLLQDGKLGHEIHPLYNKLHANYAALNNPSMYNDSSNFLRCDDSSSVITSLFVNSNGFPWVLNDLPMDLPWPKEGVSILEAYPNFDDFVISNSSLDWYSNINGNRILSNLN
ncbi:LruC domain-containing protein [Polaribacter sp. KT25b]|uniref:LruC domain-containing protein n=1 Tax=Polaribacter sp. KT25b TaxID=1855336 RepID=UPI00087CA0B1|nr:LruC domain-containing protein [Polaribacter sp. KT25b]SDS35453.1 LruC domain-containing protein [Polaribacter sp. KT25b]